MLFAIVINLDYTAFPQDHCRRVWAAIRDAMVEAGFRHEGRLFTIQAGADEACARAWEVLESIDTTAILGAEARRDLCSMLKEFYGYDHSQARNLLLPPTTGIEVAED